MNKGFIFSIVAGALLVSCSSKSFSGTVEDSGMNISWFGTQDKQFTNNLELAFERLNTFLTAQNLSQKPIQKFIDEIIHFESKDLFDLEMKRLTDGKMKTVPRTYVAVGDGGTLRTVSLAAYLKVHPKHSKKDFISILVHEAAHIFHSKTYGDEGMGPVWFFEGFAVVAADQYVDEATLSMKEMQSIAESEKRGNYKKYGFMVRELNKAYPLEAMLQKAKNEPQNFLSYLGLK